jgi:hypothetical protein
VADLAHYKLSDVLETPVILPFAGCKKILGIDETVITREDMTSFNAWYQLAVKHSQNLGERDFVSTRLFYKYFMLSLGLLEFPVVLIGGKRGNGKSMIASFLTYCSVQLFGKVATMEKPPPDPDKFGKINYLHDQSYVDDIILGLAYLDKVERETGKRPSEEELMKCILYKAVFWCDEAHMWGDRSRTYQLTVLVNRLIMIARHLYMAMYFSYVEIDRANKLILPNATHIINCGKNWFPSMGDGICSFQITDVRAGGTGASKFIHLNPVDWLDLWDSYNIPSVVRDVNIYLGGNQKKRPAAPTIDLEAAAEAIKHKSKAGV